jgi:hypothetical protein
MWQKTVVFDYVQKNMEFVFEPPYLGTNTKSFEVIFNLDKAFAVNKIDLAIIDKVLLDNISLNMAEALSRSQT